MEWYRQIWATELFLGLALILALLLTWFSLKAGLKAKAAISAALVLILVGTGIWLYQISPRTLQRKQLAGRTAEKERKTRATWRPPVLSDVPAYEILTEEDLSTPETSKTVVKIWVEPTLPKEKVKLAIAEATFKKLTADLSKTSLAPCLDIVWVYVFNKKMKAVEDLAAFDENIWFVGQSQWVNPRLPEEWRPEPLEANDKIFDIKIRWSSRYSNP